MRREQNGTGVRGIGRRFAGGLARAALAGWAGWAACAGGCGDSGVEPVRSERFPAEAQIEAIEMDPHEHGGVSKQ